jgi:hypothetical protein
MSHNALCLFLAGQLASDRDFASPRELTHFDWLSDAVFAKFADLISKSFKTVRPALLELLRAHIHLGH